MTNLLAAKHLQRMMMPTKIADLTVSGALGDRRYQY
jgi:hypothetical protein